MKTQGLKYIFVFVEEFKHTEFFTSYGDFERRGLLQSIKTKAKPKVAVEKTYKTFKNKLNHLIN